MILPDMKRHFQYLIHQVPIHKRRDILDVWHVNHRTIIDGAESSMIEIRYFIIREVFCNGCIQHVKILLREGSISEGIFVRYIFIMGKLRKNDIA